MSWTAAQLSNHHHFPKPYIQVRKAPQIAVTCLGQLPPPTQEREAENSSSDVKVGRLGKHTEQLRREGQLSPLGCLSPLLHKLYPAHYSRRNWKLPWWKLHHTAVFACSLLQHWLSTTKRGGKKTPNPTKICFQHFFCNPFNCQTSSWSSSSSPTCFSLLFQQGKVYGLKKKKNHLLQTCCRTSSKQFAGAWQPP